MMKTAGAFDSGLHDENCDCMFCEFGDPCYAKIWISVTNGVMTLIAFEGSFSANFSDAKAYETYGPEREVVDLVRP